MAEDEGRDRSSEDLFEDLDKFFAPIQDVEWPEEGAQQPTGAGKPADAGDPVAPEEPVPEIFDADVEAPIRWEEPPAPAGEAGPGEPAPATPAEEPGGFRTPAASSGPPDEPGASEPVASPGGPGTLAEDMFGPGTDPGSETPAAAGDMFESEAPAAGDLLPEGWATGLDDGIDLDVDVPPAGTEEPAAGGRFLGEPTAEMSGDDWAELQTGSRAEDVEPVEGRQEPYSYMERFLPDPDATEVPEFGYGPDPGAGATPTGGTTGIDWEEPAAATPGPGSLEDSGPISIDDLRRAPDAYRDLPGPDTDHPGDAGLGGDEAAPGPIPDEPPGAGDLEAAAEHFAASIREEEPDLGLAHDDPLAPAADPFGEATGAGVEVFGTGEHREPYSEHPEPLVFPGEGEEEHDDLLSFGEPGGPRTVKVSAAEGTGPSWQEPTSVDVPVEGEQEPPRPARNLSAAIITGVVLAVVALLALWAGKPFFGFVAGAVVLLAQLELYTAIRKRGYQPAVPLGLAIGGLICAGGYLKADAGILAMTALGVLFTPLWYMATPARQRKNVVANMGITLLGIMAVPFLGGFALAIIHGSSRAFTILVLGLAFGFDIVAYAVGTLTGSKPLAPSISPNKTREGVYAGFMVLVIVGLVVHPAPLTNVWQGLAVGIAAAAAAALGDLAESLIKRDLGVKDMGTVFPGHGGALDRIDSILFVAPVVYYVVRILLG